MFLKNIFTLNFDDKRIFGLDILRAYAILGVLWSHSAQFIPERYSYVYRNVFLEGVDIFFVLSGFLIGGILIKILENNKPSLKLLLDFWFRRWMRTIPNYFLVLVTLIIIKCVFGQPDTNFISYFLFSQNLFSVHPGFFPEAWSLAVEEWFYLLTPCVMIFFILLIRNKKAAIISTALLIIIAAMIVRYNMLFTHRPSSLEEWDVSFRKIVATRLDALMFGVIGAYLSFYHKDLFIRHKKTLLILGIALATISGHLPVAIDSVYNCVFSFTLFSIGILFCLPYLSQLKNGPRLIQKPITFISLISYSLYLTNLTLVSSFFIQDIIKRHIYTRMGLPDHIGNAISYVLFWCLTFLVSTLLYKYFELPVMRLRDKKSAVGKLHNEETLIVNGSQK